MSDRRRLSIQEQAEMVGDIVFRCRMADGSIAAESYVLLDREKIQALADLADRLERIAPYENDIRRMVTR